MSPRKHYFSISNEFPLSKVKKNRLISGNMRAISYDSTGREKKTNVILKDNGFPNKI